jgi:hypothetical protein
VNINTRARFKGLPVTIPEGYIPGRDRTDDGDQKVTHLYHGDFSDPGLPMCKRGWNADLGGGYSIFRNCIGPKGICKVCLKRAQAGKEGVIGDGLPMDPRCKECHEFKSEDCSGGSRKQVKADCPLDGQAAGEVRRS